MIRKYHVYNLSYKITTLKVVERKFRRKMQNKSIVRHPVSFNYNQKNVAAFFSFFSFCILCLFDDEESNIACLLAKRKSVDSIITRLKDLPPSHNLSGLIMLDFTVCHITIFNTNQH